MSKDSPAYPLGELPIKVGRAYFAKDKRGQTHSTMLLAAMYGDGEHKGAKVTFSAAGKTVRVQFEYPGDSEDDKAQQQYDVDIDDIAEACFALNERRRRGKFLDAPPLELP